MANGLVYVVLLFATGEWRRIVPTSWSIFPEAWESLKIYAGFGVPGIEHFTPYDAGQKLMYFVVIFLAAPLMMATGPVMSPAFRGRFPWYPKMLGGVQAISSVSNRISSEGNRISRVAVVIQVPTTGLSVNLDGCSADDLSFCGGVQVTVAAGMPWDDFVAHAVEQGWVGVEALSGLPGTVGAVVRGNAAAYGRQVCDTVAAVRTWDPDDEAQHTYAMADCGFGPGRSRFGSTPGDGGAAPVLLDVSFLLRQGDVTPPLRDPALARLVGAALGERVSLAAVREAVLAARAAAG